MRTACGCTTPGFNVNVMTRISLVTSRLASELRGGALEVPCIRTRPEGTACAVYTRDGMHSLPGSSTSDG